MYQDGRVVTFSQSDDQMIKRKSSSAENANEDQRSNSIIRNQEKIETKTQPTKNWNQTNDNILSDGKGGNIEYKKNYIGGHYSFGKVNFTATQSTFLKDNGYSGKNYYSVVIDYAHRITKNMEFITGLSVTVVKMDELDTNYYT